MHVYNSGCIISCIGRVDIRNINRDTRIYYWDILFL